MRESKRPLYCARKASKVSLSSASRMRLEKMPQIRSRTAATDGTVALAVNGRGVAFILGIVEVDDALPREQVSVAAVTRGHDAIEQVDAPCNALDEVGGGADAHEIADLVRGDVLFQHVEDVVHHFGGLPYR